MGDDDRRLRAGRRRAAVAAAGTGRRLNRPPGPQTPDDRAAFGRGQRIALLAAFALLVALRLPQSWTHGRFLDEEATVFFAYAWHHPWLDALFRPFAGYWNLSANTTTLIVVHLVKGGVVPLERAPYLTMTMALAAQLLPALLILTGRASWLAARLAVVAALLVVVLVPAAEEVFLNVLHIQFHLALCAALILALDVPRRRRGRVAYGVPLILAPLCGPAAIVILPLFVLRALVDRSLARIAQTAALAAGAAVQLLLFYGSSPMRGHLLDPGTIAAMAFVRLIALPLLNFGSAIRIGAAIDQSQVAGGTGWWWAAAAAVALFGVLVVAAARRRDSALWLILSGLGIAVTSFGFGMVVIHREDLYSVGAGERYDFLPLVLLAWGLIAMAMRQDSGGSSRARLVYGAICLLFLLTGVIRYPRPLPVFADGPSWPAEVAAWRRDHDHPLAVWPAPWAANLSDHARACSPIGRDLARSTDPRYCESGWAASFLQPRQR